MSTGELPAAAADPFELPQVCRQFAEQSPQPMVVVVGPEHVVRYLNPAFARLAGKTPDGLVGRPFAEAVPEGAGNGCLALLDRVFRTGVPESLAEQEHRRAEPSYWSYAVWAILGADARPAGFLIQVTDVTEAAAYRRRAAAMNEALIVSSVRQHELVEAVERGAREALEAAMNGEPLEASLGALVHIATDWLGPDTRAAFYLADGEGTSLRHLVGMPGAHAEAVDGFRIGPESLACGLAAHAGRPVLTGDVMKDPLREPWGWLADRLDYRGCWSFPVHTSGGNLVGALAVYSRQPREATERDLELASLLTHTAAMIISRHTESEARKRAEAALREANEDLERRVAERTAELRAAQETALRAERLAAIGEMMAGLAHESRNALQRVQACLSMVELRIRDRPDALDLLARAQTAQDDLRSLYDEVQQYAAPIRLDLCPCDLGAVWREAWADLAGQAARAELREQPGGPDPRVTADPGRLKRVFRNLFENALASGADPLRVTVASCAATLGSRPAVRISVGDNGPGIPPGDRDRVFAPFYTTKTQGTGLGLAICRRIVEAHGGTLVAGPGGPGAELVFTLPR
jgi:PAS domain S-box-containing protein